MLEICFYQSPSRIGEEIKNGESFSFRLLCSEPDAVITYTSNFEFSMDMWVTAWYESRLKLILQVLHLTLKMYVC